MKKTLFLLLLLYCFTAKAQHCRWDCVGMVLVDIQYAADRTESQVNIALRNNDHRGLHDTISGVEEGVFYKTEDFIRDRKKKIRENEWFDTDTVFSFANGLWLAKFNYCKHRDGKIYIAVPDTRRRDLYYHYYEVPPEKRIHLHDYYELLHSNNQEELKKKLKPFIIPVLII